MKQTAIFPGRYVQQEGALRELGEEVVRLGTNALIVAGGTAAESIVPKYEGAWSERFRLTVERFAGECCDDEIARLASIAKEQQCDVVMGMGGGKVIDTAKAVGHEAGSRVAIVPTIASTDAPTSAVSVIYSPEGAFDRYLFVPRNPDLVFVDTNVIAEAPVRFLVAGMGEERFLTARRSLKRKSTNSRTAFERLNASWNSRRSQRGNIRASAVPGALSHRMDALEVGRISLTCIVTDEGQVNLPTTDSSVAYFALGARSPRPRHLRLFFRAHVRLTLSLFASEVSDET